MYVNLSIHLGSQTKLLRIQIMQLRETMENVSAQQKNLKSLIILCIKRNNHCLNLLEKLEVIYSPYMFAQFFTGSIIVCIVCFQIVIVSIDLKQSRVLKKN